MNGPLIKNQNLCFTYVSKSHPKRKKRSLRTTLFTGSSLIEEHSLNQNLKQNYLPWVLFSENTPSPYLLSSKAYHRCTINLDFLSCWRFEICLGITFFGVERIVSWVHEKDLRYLIDRVHPNITSFRFLMNLIK